MTDGNDMLAVIRSAAFGLAGSSEIDGNSVTAWARAGTRFAVLDGRTLELRVGTAIAAAALRTPDARTSLEGPDWVVFEPSVLDGHALDRLKAWFVAAHRRAAPGGCC